MRLLEVFLGPLLATCALAQSSSLSLDSDTRVALGFGGTARAEVAKAARSRAISERKAIVSAVNVMNALIFPALAAAATYDELWQAMQFANTQNFRDDIGTILAVPADGKAFDLGNEPAFLTMVTEPIDKIGLRWQHSSRQDAWEQLDCALSHQLRAQVLRIRDAQAGHPDAQHAILAARKAFALAHGSVFGHSPREYLTTQEWADYQAVQAAAEYRLQHPVLGPGSNSP
jgi:hypothetical protein